MLGSAGLPSSSTLHSQQAVQDVAAQSERPAPGTQQVLDKASWPEVGKMLGLVGNPLSSLAPEQICWMTALRSHNEPRK